MTPADKEALIEAVATAHRYVDVDGRIQSAPEFWDLDEADRIEAHQQALRSRLMEAALDTQDLSSTAKRVLALIDATD